MAASTDFEPKSATVDGTEITFYDSGDEHGRPGDTVVLVHGTGGTARSHFGFLYPVLATKQRTIAVDWAQTSEGAGDLTVEALAGQVAGVIERAAPGGKVVLLGYSLGAVVAAQLAAARPDLVGRLVLVAGWQKTDIQQILRNDTWWALRKADTTGLQRFTGFCVYSGAFLTGQPKEQLEEALGRISFGSFGDQQMDLNRRVDITELTPTIEQPTLIVSGTADIMVPAHHQRALFGSIPNSRLADVDSGHGIVHERPAELSHHVQRFIDDPERHPAGTIIPRPGS
ncbi:alpha/beta fold hydrolase [Corynebacterium otitidis]|uniref:AB hydrolase-1 domain-containing protein n=1 Tax=Corynebacterium otitidis ATCC 51513 TaxID=883169 RepID=I7LCI9_9CORY|nr:alpha/beta hydrolase [Corynebacterium otitidis]EJZ81335.1 hypothetical protein HMPREF9719_01743 [Corynebacterium otitidis ATCC 51513]CCI83999.1 hypothetical protein BN46_1277 [Corynebacterium otitidis ATCC 51513]